jgi:hypothetical protein
VAVHRGIRPGRQTDPARRAPFGGVSKLESSSTSTTTSAPGLRDSCPSRRATTTTESWRRQSTPRSSSLPRCSTPLRQVRSLGLRHDGPRRPLHGQVVRRQVLSVRRCRQGRRERHIQHPLRRGCDGYAAGAVEPAWRESEHPGQRGLVDGLVCRQERRAPLPHKRRVLAAGFESRSGHSRTTNGYGLARVSWSALTRARLQWRCWVTMSGRRLRGR